MKNFVLSFIYITAFCFAFITNAQEIKKPSEFKAIDFLNKGELDMAKAHIDGYIAEPKNAKKLTKGKPWLTKAKVYSAIALAEDEKYASLSDNPLEEVMSALDKVKEYEKESTQTYMEAFGPQLPGFAAPIVDNLYGAFFNKAVDAYNADDLETSIENFEKVLVVVPTDTNSVLNIINAAYNLEPADEAKIRTYCQKLIDLNYDKPTGFKYLAQLDLNLAEEMRAEAENAADSAKMLEFYAAALETVNAGRKAFPEDQDLQTHQINCYIRLDKTDEAIASLEDAVAAKPDKQLYFNLGILYDRTDNFEKSAEKYKKAIELDPDYYDANFNLGAMYFTLGNKKIVASGEHKDMNGKFTSDEGKKLEEEGKDLFGKAVPYFEKITQLEPKERQSYEILERMFYYLGEKEKLAAVRKQLEALPEAGE
ncbi:tetratricopeptide repeat protein [Flexithrix dorotheae]|uniref:tetratricopeptide repeat protein n=1 Tax=Flexithrix dorotheae TaxID=70993 RepID=UPI000363EDAE|nr:tetratricopeptide repeat protein [Flexithrix dorotheae]